MQQMIELTELKRFTGMQRAAALMLSLGKENGALIWQQLGMDEVKELSTAMAQFGQVPAYIVEHLLILFSNEISTISSLHGSFKTTERLLEGILPENKLKEVIEDIRGLSGRTMWDKLSNASENVLAAFLKNEYPQTVAVIMSKLKCEHCARVLAALPRDFAIDVIQRMLRRETVQKEIISEIEATSETEFMHNLLRSQRRDPHEAMADIFNAFDRATKEAIWGALDKRVPESAKRIRALMFTFDDLANLTPSAVGVLVKNADKHQIALALKGAPEEMRRIFLGAMTERVAKMLREGIASMGPVRAGECEEAQTGLVRLARLLADRGEIILIDPKKDGTMII